MPKIDDDVRDHVALMVAGVLPLDAFEEWFVGNTWDDRSPLVAHVDHLLAERAVLAEEEFLAEVWRAVSTIMVEPLTPTANAERFVEFVSSVTATIRRRLEFAGTPRAAAPA